MLVSKLLQQAIVFLNIYNVVLALETLFPWQITAVHSSAPVGNGKCSMSFDIRDLNTIPAVPSDIYPNPFPQFNATQTTCTFEWNTSDKVPVNVDTTCDPQTDEESWGATISTTATNSRDLAKNFTVELNMGQFLIYNNVSYYKQFSANVSFNVPGNMKGSCNDTMCIWSLKSSHTPTLVTQNMTLCQGDCDWTKWYW
jgi:hypothetical protein